MSCACNQDKKTIITACSGAANVGLLADRVARSLRDGGAGSMTCLAALGAGLSGYVQSAKTADRNLVIDGCPIACGKAIYENIGAPFQHFILTEYGVEKGKTPITDELVSVMTNKLKAAVGCCG